MHTRYVLVNRFLGGGSDAGSTPITQRFLTRQVGNRADWSATVPPRSLARSPGAAAAHGMGSLVDPRRHRRHGRRPAHRAGRAGGVRRGRGRVPAPRRGRGVRRRLHRLLVVGADHRRRPLRDRRSGRTDRGTLARPRRGAGQASSAVGASGRPAGGPRRRHRVGLRPQHPARRPAHPQHRAVVASPRGQLLTAADAVVVRRGARGCDHPDRHVDQPDRLGLPRSGGPRTARRVHHHPGRPPGGGGRRGGARRAQPRAAQAEDHAR